MLVILLIGWTILLPAVVVAGLYIGSTVLGRRRAAQHAYEDLLEQEALAAEAEVQRAYVAPDTRPAFEPTVVRTPRPAVARRSDPAEPSDRRAVGAVRDRGA